MAEELPEKKKKPDALRRSGFSLQLR